MIKKEKMAAGRRSLILFFFLHIYIAFAALCFQYFEFIPREENRRNMKRIQYLLMKDYNISMQETVNLIGDILEAKKNDQNIEMSEAWRSFPTSLWFVMILFTTVGTGHIVPQTFGGRLFCMLSSLFGIPLYALFLKYAGEQIINVLRGFIEIIEIKIMKRESKEIRQMNIKVLISAFLLMTSIILIGALGSFAFKWTYFEGIYFCFISLSTVGFGDLVPTINDDQGQIFSVVYMFYNVLGLTVVSCFISSLINSMEEISTLWRSLKMEANFAKRFVNKSRACSEIGKETSTEDTVIEK